MGNLLTALLVGIMTGFFRLHWDLNTSYHDGKNFSHFWRNVAISPFCLKKSTIPIQPICAKPES